jgi:hypothetical protein
VLKVAVIIKSSAQIPRTIPPDENNRLVLADVPSPRVIDLFHVHVITPFSIFAVCDDYGIQRVVAKICNKFPVGHDALPLCDWSKVGYRNEDMFKSRIMKQGFDLRSQV